jgi:hypothetical protein
MDCLVWVGRPGRFDHGSARPRRFADRFGREPVGGASGLVVLYLATAIAGIGLAALGRIVPIALPASGFAVTAPRPIEGLPPPKVRTDTREAA